MQRFFVSQPAIKNWSRLKFLCYDSFTMDRRKLFLYVLLNVFVSACVTGSILFWYDRNYRASLSPVAAPAVVSGVDQAAPAAETLSPQTDIAVEIVSVVGAGTLTVESAVIRYSGDGELNLAGWQLKDEDGNTFTFPQLTLYTNGAVQVHTVTGTDTVIDLYWGAPDAVWGSAENARLYDAQGNLRAVYRVP
jgi:hypothetical protein